MLQATFDYAGLKPGGSTTRHVSVSLTDLDGLIVQTTHSVSIYMATSDPDNNFPPVCRVKPWLPVCKVQ